MKVHMVLGAGGAAGWVFHAGVLRTLAEETGWDARRARLLVGTSAGSAVAAGLRFGVGPAEIVTAVTRGPSDEEREALRAEMADHKRTYRPLAPGMLRHLLPGGAGAAVALAGILPPGLFPTIGLGNFPGVNGHRDWPGGLWIPSVRVGDGRVVVFGRDRCDVTVRDAVEASSAVPGIFRPKRLGDEVFVDGGLASPTHADLAAADRPDLVIVSSPMSRRSRRPMSVLARRRLRPERAVLERSAARTVIIQPGDGAADVFRGFPRRNPGAAPAILALAEDATRRALAYTGAGTALVEAG
jgi:NTE family protein